MFFVNYKDQVYKMNHMNRARVFFLFIIIPYIFSNCTNQTPESKVAKSDSLNLQK